MRVLASTVLAVLVAGMLSACGASHTDQKPFRPAPGSLKSLAPPRRPASSSDHVAPAASAGCARPYGEKRHIASGAKDAPICRVLFVGNSYSYVNQLPSVFQKLAVAGRHTAQVGLVARPNETLAEHAASHDVASAVAETDWDIVVLQEQSEIPASENLRRADMYPAARQLAQLIRARGAETMLFLTWAHSEGWPAGGMSTYSAMQAAVDRGYLALGRALGAAIAPVGLAWAATLASEQRPGRNSGLWEPDGSHPTVRGTYLAACVFYAAIFRETPVGLTYRSGLSEEEANSLQATASRVVLSDPVEWHLATAQRRER